MYINEGCWRWLANPAVMKIKLNSESKGVRKQIHHAHVENTGRGDYPVPFAEAFHRQIHSGSTTQVHFYSKEMLNSPDPLGKYATRTFLFTGDANLPR